MEKNNTPPLDESVNEIMPSQHFSIDSTYPIVKLKPIASDEHTPIPTSKPKPKRLRNPRPILFL
jgi:hypothetical protein